MATTFTAAVVGGVVIGRLGLDEHVKPAPGIGGATPTDEAAVATDGGAVADAGTASCGCGCAPAPDRIHRERVGTAARGARRLLALARCLSDCGGFTLDVGDTLQVCVTRRSTTEACCPA